MNSRTSKGFSFGTRSASVYYVHATYNQLQPATASTQGGHSSRVDTGPREQSHHHEIVARPHPRGAMCSGSPLGRSNTIHDRCSKTQLPCCWRRTTYHRVRNMNSIITLYQLCMTQVWVGTAVAWVVATRLRIPRINGRQALGALSLSSRAGPTVYGWVDGRLTFFCSRISVIVIVEMNQTVPGTMYWYLYV